MGTTKKGEVSREAREGDEVQRLRWRDKVQAFVAVVRVCILSKLHVRGGL